MFVTQPRCTLKMTIRICNSECLRWFPPSSHPWCLSSVTCCWSLGLLGLCSINQSASQVCEQKTQTFSVVSCFLLSLQENIKSSIWKLWYRHSPTVLQNYDLSEKMDIEIIWFSKCSFKSSYLIQAFEQFSVAFRRELLLAMSVFISIFEPYFK